MRNRQLICVSNNLTSHYKLTLFNSTNVYTSDLRKKISSTWCMIQRGIARSRANYGEHTARSSQIRKKTGAGRGTRRQDDEERRGETTVGHVEAGE